MKRCLYSFILNVMLFAGFLLTLPALSANAGQVRIFMVDSYHPEYLWSQDTSEGFARGLLDFQFLENEEEYNILQASDAVSGQNAVVKRVWMDTKRKNTKPEIAASTAAIIFAMEEFQPDIVFLGDDNASNYIGNYLMDRDVPVVFWGINGLPFKYGLIDSLERPGHNITGIYQPGTIKLCLDLLVKILPGTETVAILADDSESSRAKVKGLLNLVNEGQIPLRVTETVVTNSYAQWQEAALRFAQAAQTVVVFNHNTLRDDEGGNVDQLTAGGWYLRHVRKPDCSDAKQFVQEGILLAVDDSGYRQAYEAVRYAHGILRESRRPADMPVKAPEPGAVIANRERARQLGIDLQDFGFIDTVIEKALALEVVR